MRLRNCCWIAACLGFLVACPLSAAERPNILMISLDDLNDWTGCLGGHPQALTPNIDRLAARGTLFTNAHCQATLCNSSRTSLMTGLRASTTGIYSLGPWFRNVPELKDVVSLPQYLRQHGYTAWNSGKTYHNGHPPAQWKEQEFHDYGPPADVGVKPETKLIETPLGNHPLVDWGTFPHRDEDKGDWKVADWAIEKLESSTEEPFFLAVGFFLPHLPCYATEKWFDLYPLETLVLPTVPSDDRLDTPDFSWYLNWKLPEPRLSWLKENNQWEALVRAYLASVSFADSQVGRVLDALEKSGKADNTIVVLWSDHGWHLGEKGVTAKTTLWHESTRVPLIFAGPGVAAGAKCGQPAELLDIYPTLASLCGLPEKIDLEGHDLSPQLKDAKAPRVWPAITTECPGNHAIINDRWRYIQYADGSEELYDFISDPSEWKNLANDPQFESQKAKLKKWVPKYNAPPAPGSKARMVVQQDGVWLWEGEPIVPSERVE